MADKETITATWIGKMAFEAQVNGHSLLLDAPADSGGEDRGPRPKPLMLVALAGCTAMDVIAILQKMRLEVARFAVRVEGDLTDEYPRHFHRMHVIFEFAGNDLPMDKLRKAVALSEERYCGVSAVYRKALQLTSEIRVLDA